MTLNLILLIEMISYSENRETKWEKEDDVQRAEERNKL